VSLEELEVELPGEEAASEEFDLTWVRTVLAETLRRMETDCKNPAGDQPRRSYIWEMFHIAFWVSDVTGPGTYPLLLESAVSRINPSATYTLDSGTITFTTYDLANQKLTGTFSFTASTDSGTVSVSSGSFRISKIISN
jgi:hypothetical protein